MQSQNFIIKSPGALFPGTVEIFSGGFFNVLLQYNSFYCFY